MSLVGWLISHYLSLGLLHLPVVLWHEDGAVLLPQVEAAEREHLPDDLNRGHVARDVRGRRVLADERARDVNVLVDGERADRHGRKLLPFDPLKAGSAVYVYQNLKEEDTLVS